jgi:hypothetical protein
MSSWFILQNGDGVEQDLDLIVFGTRKQHFKKNKSTQFSLFVYQ